MPEICTYICSNITLFGIYLGFKLLMRRETRRISDYRQNYVS